MTETTRWSARESVAVALLLAALIAVFFADPIFTGRTFFYRDLGLAVRPVLEEARRARGGGVDALPLWTHHLSQGRPLLANPGYALLHPMNVLYLVLPFGAAFEAFIVLHVLVAALGMAALARHVGASPAGGFAAGACFALGGPFLSTTNLYPTLASAAWAPLTLIAGVAACAQPRAWRVGLLALSLAVQALGGQPEPVLMTGALGLAWCAAVGRDGSPLRRLARATLVWTAGAAWAFLLAAPQVLPSLHLLRGSVRSLGFTAQGVTANSLDPHRALTLLLPIEDAGAPYLLTLYLGMVAVALGACGVVLSRRDASGEERTLLERSAVPLAILAGAGALLSLGSHLPGFAAFVGALRSPLRYPEKLTFLAGLAVPLLAALGVDAVARRARSRAVALLLAAAACGDLLLAHRDVAPTIEAQSLDAPPPLFDEVRRRAQADGIADGQWRLYHLRTPTGWPIPGDVMRGGEPESLLRWQRGMLMPAAALPFGLHHAHERVGDQLDALDYVGLSREIHALPLPEMAAALGRCGVLFVVAPAAGLGPPSAGVLAALRDLGPAEGFPEDSGTLYRNTAFVPRARLEGAGEIVSIEENHAGLVIRLRADGAGTLVLSDALSEGWEAAVDGAGAELVRRDAATRALAVPAGAREVVLRHVPPGLLAGAVLAGLGIIGLVAAAVLRR